MLCLSDYAELSITVRRGDSKNLKDYIETMARLWYRYRRYRYLKGGSRY